jgi:N-acetylglucosamine-6-phosphate deacetylase
MDKIVLVSRHVVLIKERIPIYAAIVISGDEIIEIKRIDNDVAIQDLVEHYQNKGASVHNYEHSYISPGVVDIHVTSNCESLTEIT